MKVTETQQKNAIGKIDISVRDTKIQSNDQTAFTKSMQKVLNENFQAKISGLLNQIAEQAEKLSKKVDIRDLKTYKRLVSDFLDEAVNNSHKFSKENKLDRRGRHRVYAIIKRVNDNLEDLTQEVLKDEKDNLLVLQKLDDIRGLLLDVTT